MKRFSMIQWLALTIALGILSAGSARAADQTKADNADALDLSTSWVGSALPGGGDRAIWDGTLSAANCTNSAGTSTLNVGQIQIKNPSGGVPVSITGSSAWWRLLGVGGICIDMSAAAVDLTIGSGFTVQSQSGTQIFTNATGRTLTISGQIYLGDTVGRTLTLDGGGNYVFSGSLSGSANGKLIKQGSGALTISVPNYACSNLVLNAGTLNLNQNYAINGNANSRLTINGGTIDSTVAGIGLTANPPIYDWNGDFAFTGTQNLDLGGGVVTLSGNRQVTVSANTLTVGGAIGDGSFGYSLTKAGAGTLELSGASTYSGNTFINAGTLALSGSGSFASSPNITVASGATFDVSAKSSALTLGTGQTLKASATGANTTATIKGSGSLVLNLSAGGLVFTAYGGGATAPLTASGATGAVNMNGAPVTVTTTTPLLAGTYTLIDAASGGSVTGTPGTLTVNGSGTAANTIFSVAVTSSKLVLTVASTAQIKADNATTLDLGGSWISGSTPSSSQWAIWTGTYTPANLTNGSVGGLTWGGILVSNVTGAPVTITNGVGGALLSLNGVGGVGVDMSAATVDLTLAVGRLTILQNQTWTVATNRTLTFPNTISPFAFNLNSGGHSNNLTLNGGGNFVFTGNLYDDSATSILAMSGTGVCTLAAANGVKNYTLSSGTLNLNHDYAINGNANSQLTINGGTIDNTSGNTVSLQNNPPTYNWNGDFAFTGTQNLDLGGGAVTLSANRQVTVRQRQ